MSEFKGSALERIAEAFAGPEWPIFQNVEAVEQGFQIECFIEDQVRWFDGHFENQPVLPGVTQVHWAAELAKHLFELNSDAYSGMDNVKFHNSILPNAEVSLTLQLNEAKKKVKFSFHSNERLCSEGSLVFTRSAA